jgi:hypothetical protein
MAKSYVVTEFESAFIGDENIVLDAKALLDPLLLNFN